MTFWNHPEFLQEVETKLFRKWREQGILQLQHVVSVAEKRYLTFLEIQTQFQFSNAHYLAYCQLLCFLKAWLRDISHEVSHNKFDNLLGPSTANHSLARLYCGIRETINGFNPTELFSKWDREFPVADLPDRILVNERWCETPFKFIHQAIYGSDILPHPNCLDRLMACPKCSTPRTSLIHGVWYCPSVSQIW